MKKRLSNKYKEIAEVLLLNVGSGSSMDQIQTANILKQLNQEVFQGGKRFVVVDQDDPTMVVKFASGPRGIADNQNEVTVTEKLYQMVEAGLIVQADMNLFAAAFIPENGDLSAIVQERVTRFDEVPEIIEYCEKMRLQDPLFTYDRAIIKYISEVETLRNSYNRIQDILTNSRQFVSSDVSIFTEYENFGIKMMGGQPYICILDLGNIIPRIYDDNGVEMCPTCQFCGSPLEPRIYDIQPNITITDIITQEKIQQSYGCTNPSCINFYDNVSNQNAVMRVASDTNVYTSYVYSLTNQINKLRFISTLYSPEVNVDCDMGTYHNNVLNLYGLNMNQEQLLKSYRFATVMAVANALISTPDFEAITSQITPEMFQYGVLMQDTNVPSIMVQFNQMFSQVTNINSRIYKLTCLLAYVLKKGSSVSYAFDLIRSTTPEEINMSCINLGLAEADIAAAMQLILQ